MFKFKLFLPTSTYNLNSTNTNTFTTYYQQKTNLANNTLTTNIASAESYRTDSLQHIDTTNMTNKIIPTNSICELHFTKLNSPTIPNIQPPSLHSPHILTKTLYHITTNFPTNPPVQVYPTISTNISHSHDNHNSKLANAIYSIPNLINQKQILLSSKINNITLSSSSQTDP